jgi:heme exporter protein D
MNDFVMNFVSMGGYGLYVWLVYGMALLVLFINLLLPLWQHHKLLSKLSYQKDMLKRTHESNP